VRQLLSWRFVAAVVALAVLAAGALLLQSGRSGLSSLDSQADEQTRRMDVISLVTSVGQNGFSMDEHGRVAGQLALGVQIGGESREVQIFEGTPGEVTCEPLAEFQCALLAETLADSVVWFAVVPMLPNFRFELGAIEDLQDGYAHLDNGWEVPYANVIDRSCDPDVASFSEFLDKHGGDFRSIYDLTYGDGAGGIVQVTCPEGRPAPTESVAGTAPTG
jgi:hypothetical protein